MSHPSSQYALILHGDTPAGRAAEQAALKRGFKVIVVRHNVKLAIEKDDFTFDLQTSELKEVELLANHLNELDIKIDTLITCPQTVFSEIKDLKSFEETSQDSWDKTMAGNLNAAMLFCRVFGSRMRTRGQGRIIQLLSNVVLDPHHPNPLAPPPSLAYACAMAGLQALTRHLAVQYQGCGILINNLIYGPLKESDPETITAAYVNRVPLGRIMTVSDLANTLDLLLDPKNNYMTGQNVVADGGVTIW